MTVEEMKNINFIVVGRELLNSNKGVITPYGVLYLLAMYPSWYIMANTFLDIPGVVMRWQLLF